MNLNSKIKGIIGVLLGIVIIIGAWFIMGMVASKKKTPKKEVKKIVKTVFSEKVKNTDILVFLEASGEVVAKRRIDIFSEVQGVFQGSAHDFKEGTKYRKEENLLRINSANQRYAVQSLKSKFYNLILAMLADMQIDMPKAYKKWNKYLSEFKFRANVVNLPKITSSKEQRFVSARNVISTYFDLKNQERLLAKYQILAPFDGVLISALVTKGSLVRAGQKLGSFIDTSVYEIRLDINPKLASQIKIGEVVKISDIQSDNEWEGKVVRVNSSVSRSTQTVATYIEVSGKHIKEGMYLKTMIKGAPIHNAYEVPREILMNGNEIFSIENNTLELIKVSPVYFTEKTVVIKGIPNNTKIVSRLVPGAYKGMQVQISK